MSSTKTHSKYALKRRSALSIDKFDFKLKLIYQNTNEKIKRKTKSNKLVTKMLVIISISYALLNLPYLITWSLFYKGKLKQELKKKSQETRIYFCPI